MAWRFFGGSVLLLCKDDPVTASVLLILGLVFHGLAVFRSRKMIPGRSLRAALFYADRDFLSSWFPCSINGVTRSVCDIRVRNALN